MTPTRSLLCGCCASTRAPVALAARRGHGPAKPPARGRHGAGASRQAGQNQGVQGCTGNPTPAGGVQMFVAVLEAAGITRDQIQTMGRATTAALVMG
jgi:hypothetical protein